MSEPRRVDRETLLQAEVDRAVAAYVGRVPAAMLAKLRELAERYYRTHPETERVLDALCARTEVARSGDVARGDHTEPTARISGVRRK